MNKKAGKNFERKKFIPYIYYFHLFLSSLPSFQTFLFRKLCFILSWSSVASLPERFIIYPNSSVIKTWL